MLEQRDDGRWRQLEDGESPTRDDAIQIDACPVCSGAWFDAGELDDLADDDGDESPEATLHRGVVGAEPTQGTRMCPHGHGPMGEHHLPGRLSTPVDRCATCHGLWLDGDERRKLAKATTKEGQQTDRERWVRRGALYAAQVITQVPVEVENPHRGTPWVVYSLLALLLGMYLMQIAGQVDHHYYGVVAGRLLRQWDLDTLFTHQFFHVSWLHLLGNAYFLYTFGDNIEHLFGRKRFVAFFLGAGITGGITHVMLTHATALAMIGASGAIAGVLAAYLWSFPRQKLFHVIGVIPLRLPVWAYLVFWVGFNLFMGVATDNESVAWFSHLGGFMFGAFVAPLILHQRRREVARRVKVPWRAPA